VAAGLDSLVVGEPQILGQVKQAYASATELHATGALLNRLFHTAFTAGKRVRSETELAEGAVSVSYAALGLARKICGDLRHVSVLVVGAGEMAELTARHFAAQQPKRITVCSRTAAHAEALAQEVGGHVVDWSALDAALDGADVVVTATGATTPILDRARIQAVRKHRRGRPLFLIDIAVPRDIEPQVAKLPGVFLYDLDDLHAVAEANLRERRKEAIAAEALVEKEAREFLDWQKSRDAVPLLVELRRRGDEIRRQELEKVRSRLGPLTKEQEDALESATSAIVNKLLHAPTVALKDAARNGHEPDQVSLIRRLLGL
jgi:glutamyl-tRNA reductase